MTELGHAGPTMQTTELDLDPCHGPSGPALMSHDEAAALATLLKAMADPTRVRLLHHLSGVPGGTACACHLPGELGISQPTLSHHLKTLVEADLLTRQQQGRWAHYTVRAEALAPLTGLIASLAQEP